MQPLDQESNASKGRKAIMQWIGDISNPGNGRPTNGSGRPTTPHAHFPRAQSPTDSRKVPQPSDALSR